MHIGRFEKLHCAVSFVYRRIKEIITYLDHLPKLDRAWWAIWVTCITSFRHSPEDRVISLYDKDKDQRNKIQITHWQSRTNILSLLSKTFYPQLYPSSFWIAVMYSCCWAESGGKNSSIWVSAKAFKIVSYIYNERIQELYIIELNWIPLQD